VPNDFIILKLSQQREKCQFKQRRILHKRNAGSTPSWRYKTPRDVRTRAPWHQLWTAVRLSARLFRARAQQTRSSLPYAGSTMFNLRLPALFPCSQRKAVIPGTHRLQRSSIYDIQSCTRARCSFMPSPINAVRRASRARCSESSNQTKDETGLK
jgi:hypothetical protein